MIPLQCEYYPLEGLSALVETVEAIRSRSNPNLKIEGIVRTMYDSRNKLTAEVNAQLFRFFGDAVYRTVVPRNVKLAEAPSFGKAALSYERRSKGAIAYLALAGEILRRARPGRGRRRVEQKAEKKMSRKLGKGAGSGCWEAATGNPCRR